MKQTHVFNVNVPARGDQPARTLKIAVDVDLEAIAYRMGQRAAKNTSHRAIDVGGLVVVRHIRSKVAS